MARQEFLAVRCRDDPNRAIGHTLRQAAVERYQLEPDLFGVLVDGGEQRRVR
jgi:hypothetical protein